MILDDKDVFTNDNAGWITLSRNIVSRIPVVLGHWQPKSLIHLGEWFKKWSPQIDQELRDFGFLQREATNGD